jgi:hypothetical protein
MQKRAHMLEAILCGMKIGAKEPMNYNKVKGIVTRSKTRGKPYSLLG